jgi:hypothetical protein
MKCLIQRESSLAKNEEETKRPLDSCFQMTYYEVKDKKEIKHQGWFRNFEYINQLEALLQSEGGLWLQYREDLHDGELPIRQLMILDGGKRK